MPRIMLIAASERLAALQQNPDLSEAEAFTDAEALKALDAIARQRPEVVALEKMFAASARGAAFLNRIKANPALAALEVRIVESNTDYARPQPRPPATSGGASAAAVAIEAPSLPTGGDRNAKRRAARVGVLKNIEVLIDGNPATLIDISVRGAQVVSLSSLRPNQRVRMSLLELARPLRFNGVVAWALFEMPKEGPRYRAGIDFYDANPAEVTRFIEAIGE
jgi:PilZ domain-containing protein